MPTVNPGVGEVLDGLWAVSAIVLIVVSLHAYARNRNRERARRQMQCRDGKSSITGYVWRPRIRVARERFLSGFVYLMAVGAMITLTHSTGSIVRPIIAALFVVLSAVETVDAILDEIDAERMERDARNGHGDDFDDMIRRVHARLRGGQS